MGTILVVSCEAKGEETVRVPAGEFRAGHITKKTKTGTSDWWYHSKLGIPVRGLAGGVEYVLSSLQLNKK
jgi:hypothetical protein